MGWGVIRRDSSERYRDVKRFVAIDARGGDKVGVVWGVVWCVDGDYLCGVDYWRCYWWCCGWCCDVKRGESRDGGVFFVAVEGLFDD